MQKLAAQGEKQEEKNSREIENLNPNKGNDQVKNQGAHGGPEE